MKTEYIKPVVEEIEIAALQMMASSKPGFGDEEADDSAPLTIGRRGKWGDLWSQGE